MDIEFAGLLPRAKWLSVALVIRGAPGWVRFGTLNIPYDELSDREVLRAIVHSHAGRHELDEEDDPLF